MRATLKNIFSPDLNVPLSEFVPSNPDNFGFLATLIVGEENMGGEESFNVMICTPLWLISNHNKSDIIIGRHYLIVFEYNFICLYEKLKSIIESVEESSWDEIGLKIGRIGKWEFEDYKE